MVVRIKRTDNYAIIPTRGSNRAAGYDLYAHDVSANDASVYIPAGETKMIGTGICMEIPDGYAGFVYARSGIASKRGLRPANCVGVIDSDYRGEIKVALHNDSNICETVHNGERIAQIVIAPFLAVEFEETDKLNETARGEGGFGSTGVSGEPEYEQLSLFDALM